MTNEEEPDQYIIHTQHRNSDNVSSLTLYTNDNSVGVGVSAQSGAWFIYTATLYHWMCATQ